MAGRLAAPLGYVTNRYCHEGMNWRDAEIRAAVEVTTERKAANGGPPPVMDPDPDTALLEGLVRRDDRQRRGSPVALARRTSPAPEPC